jgi:hypothetical protein
MIQSRGETNGTERAQAIITRNEKEIITAGIKRKAKYVG